MPTCWMRCTLCTCGAFGLDPGGPVIVWSRGGRTMFSLLYVECSNRTSLLNKKGSGSGKWGMHFPFRM